MVCTEVLHASNLSAQAIRGHIVTESDPTYVAIIVAVRRTYQQHHTI